MSLPPTTAYDQLSPDQAARVDAACDDFEQAWKATQAGGAVPHIADFLERCGEAERAVLVGELIALDRACRQRYGFPVRPEDYQDYGNTDTRPAVPGAPRRGGANWPRLPGLELVEVLGVGGMGIVYKARQPALDRSVAVKTLRASGPEDAENRRRFLREARAVAQLQHPNLIQLYEIGEAPGPDEKTSLPYFVMEYV